VRPGVWLIAANEKETVMGIACVHQASRNGTKTFSEIVVVTPELASKWLARNKKNRRVYQGRVALYASQMASGEWHLTHQGIAFDELGNLVDGQHRLPHCGGQSSAFKRVLAPTEN
jgi:hypothetical protein